MSVEPAMTAKSLHAPTSIDWAAQKQLLGIMRTKPETKRRDGLTMFRFVSKFSEISSLLIVRGDISADLSGATSGGFLD